MKLKQSIFALAVMLSGFAISVNAQEAKIGTTTYGTLAEAVKAAAAGDEIVLLKNVTLTGGYADDPTAGLRIEKALTINGNKKTIDCGTFKDGIRVYINSNSKADVEFNNVTIKNDNPYGRCIDMRTGKIALEVKGGAKLIAHGVNSQPLTVGGSAATYRVRVSNATIDAGETGYGIISFVRVTNNIEFSSSVKISGLAVLYLKEGANNTTVTMGNGTYTGTNLNSAASGMFGAVVIEGKNNTITVNHEKAVIKAVAGNDANQAVQAAFLLKEGATGNKIQVTNANAQVLTEGAQAQWATVATDATNNVLINKGQTVNFAVEYNGYQFMDANEVFSKFVPQEKEATIKLLSNVALDETWTVAAGQNITLDLNGKTASMAYTKDATANHAMISNKGNLTIVDSSNGGKLSYTYAGANLGTTYAANTITSEPGSVLTVKNGIIENLTYDHATIAYAIDGRTNGGAGDVTVNIEGGVITSKRQAVRIFANSTTKTGTLNISNGDFTGRVIVQNASANANKAVLNITGGTFNANEYKSDVLYLGGSNSATIDINASVSGGTFNGEITQTNVKGFISGGTFSQPVAEAFCAKGYAPIELGNGTYGVQEGQIVALIGSAKYFSLADALAAAKDGETISLQWRDDYTPIAMNGSLYGKSVTITGTATVDWSKGFLFVGRGGVGNAKLTFDNANLTSASNQATYGIHVSGREKGTADKYDGTLVIKESTIELDYLINKGAMTLDKSSLTVKNGFDLNGRPASETESGEDANATLALTNSSKLVVNNHNGMGIGREGKGELTVDAFSTFEHTQDFIVRAKGTMDVKGTLVSNGKKLTNNGEVKFTATKLTDANIEGTGTTRFYNDVNFYGANSITTTGINGTPFHLVVNEGANLFITRFVLGYDRNITVNGTIADASAFTPEGQTPSLKFNSTSGVSVGGTGTGNLQVKNAYVELGSSSWKNAQGTYDWDFVNSYVSATSFTNATGADAATWDVTFDKSVLAAKNYIKNGKNVTYNFTNNSRGTTGSLRIDGVLNIDATSSVVTTSQQNNVQGAVDEHGGINGTVNVAGNLTIGSNAKTQLEVLGGTVNVNEGATLALGNHTLTLDASSAMQSAGNISGAITAADGANVAITGGTYTQDVSNWCADGYMTQQNADGSFGIAKAVAKVGDKKYATLEEAFKAATSGCTIDILSDVTIDSKWDCRYTGAKFLVPVTINGNGKTIKFTGSVNDMNWNTVFRFEEKAAVNNLTVDISNATGAQRVISAKKSLAVDGLNIVGAAKYGVIYGEGASATDLAATEIVVKNSTLGGTRRALSDNEGGKDVKSVVIESNTFNANVSVSAKETVTFTGNTVAGAYVNIKSYTAGNKLAVTATGNTLEANTDAAYNVIDAGGVVNAEGFNVVAKGNNFNGYTSADGIWGETWGNAKESFVIKVLDANGNVMGTTSLNNIGGIINGNVNVSWNLKFNAAANTDEYWTMEWTTAPSISNMPAKVELWVDGTRVSGGDVVLNGPDDLNKIVAAVTDADGKIISCHTSVANAAATNATNIALLRNTTEEIILPAGVKLNANGFTAANVKTAVAVIGTQKFASLQAAVNAVKDGETITLVDNVTGNVTLTEKVGLHYTLDGAGKQFKGSISVNSLSDTNDNRRITIKNIKFVDDSAAKVDFITSVNTNHYPRLTVEGCTFTGSGDATDVAVRLKSSHSVVITNCTGTGLHSFLQNTSGWNLTIDNVKVTESNGAFALGTVQGVTVKGSTIDVDGYGIRLDADTYNNNAAIEGNEVTAYIPVVVRKVNAESNVTFTGENEFTAENNDGKWMVIGTEEYEAGKELPIEVATGNVVVALNNTNLTYDGIHGAGLAGKGTAEKPYLINNVAELEIFRNSVNAGSTKYNADGRYIALNGDIDMANVDWSVNIGDDCANTFDGIFDGKNHTIKNLKSVETAQKADGYICTGLFGAIGGNAVVKNFTIENVTINTGDFTGNNVAAVVGFAYNAKGSIENVKVTGDININAKNAVGVGAILGYDYYSPELVVKNCEVKGNSGSAIVGLSYVGGAVGYASNKIQLLSNSVENVSITANNAAAGGVAGIMLAGGSAADNAVKDVVLASNHDNWKNAVGVVAGTITSGKVTIANTTIENVNTDAVAGAVHADKPTTPVAKVEARIGDAYYTTLDAALAADGDEVELLVPVTVAKDETRVLDLKGKTVSHSKACTASYEMIKNLGNLTIKNGTLSFTDTSAGDPSFGWGSYTINNYGTLVVEEGATIQHLGAQAFATHMIAAIQQAKGSTTINAGVISTPNYRSVRINGGALAINGGEFDGQVWLQPNQGDVTIAVNGGTFGPNGGDGSSIFMTNVGENNTVTSASITGGTFTTKIGCTDPAALAGIITGGKFTEAAMTATNGALIGDGFTFDKNAENGYYAVVAGLDGDGTEAAPYMITSVKELELFRESVNKGETKYNASGVWVALGADIDLANAEWTVGIGDGHNYSFDGNFDGKNHTIKNLNIEPYADADNYLCGGLFGYTYGGVTIKNLVIENAEVNFIGETGKDYHCVGILVGFANNNGGKLNVDNVTVKGDIKVDAPQTFGVGAIVGYSYRAMGSITNTKVLANAGSYIKGERFVGGITGYSDANAIIENCTVENLAISGANGVAGIAGLALDGNKITNCTVTNVTVSGNKNVAYIVGELGSGDGGNVLVNNCNAPQPWVGGSYGTGESFVATIGTKYYTSIAKAIEVAKETDVITLIIDITATEPIAIPTGKKVTLDLNGKTITGTDNTTKSYGLININPGAELTINDTAGNGAITLTATNNRGWNAYSSVISNQRGKLTVNGGTIEHLGGTDMAYAIDNLTNGKGTYAETIIIGGTMKSTYRAVRQFLNGTEAQNILTVNGGTIEGANKSIWMQNANANANPGDLTVAETAEIKGDVYVSGAGAANFPVEISVANAALKDGATVLPSNVHESFAIANNNGVWGITSSVASANGVGYASFLEAIDAAKSGETVTLLADVTLDTKTLATQDDGYAVLVNVKGKAITLDLNGKNVTVDAAAADLASAKSKMLLGVFSADLGGHLTLTDNSDAKNGAVTVNVNDAAVYSVFVSESAQKDKSNSGKITVDGGNYTTVGKVSNAMFFTDANEVITVNGGNFHCDQVSNTANYPWMFNTLGNNELHVIVNGGTFNIDINHQHRPFEVLVPETLAVRANDNGTWTVVEAEAYITEKLGSTVNEAGEWGHNVGYATLAEAIAAVNELGNKVSMAKDVELTETVVVPADKTVVLDLNGKTVSMNDASGAAVALLKNQGNLTIMDGTEAKAGKLSFKTTTPSAANAYASNTISNYGVITIESGNVENLSVGGGACYALDNYAGSTATINGGNLTAEKTAVRIFNWTNGEEAKATINMNGGEIYSKNGYGINVNSGNTPFVALNITGGTITTDYADYKLAVYVVNKGTAENFTANVTGGTFNGIFALNGVTAQTMKQDAVAVSGGTFEGVTCYEDPAYGFVSGGTFKSAVDAKAVATGFICKDNGDGTFGVIVDPKHGMVAQINRNDYFAENQYFATINDAVQAAQSGETVTLIADVETSAAGYATITDNYAVIVAVKEKNITLDLNGKSVTVTPTAEELANAEGKMLMSVFGMDTNGKLTLTGNGSVKVNANGANVYSLVAAYGEGSAVVIENGNYEADAVNANGSLIYAQQAECIAVMGGTFNLGNLGTGANGSPWIFNTKGQNYTGVKVVGGTYPTDINHQFWANEVLVPEAYALEDNGDGTWTVVPAVAYTNEKATSRGASWRHVGYASLEDAIAATGKYNCQDNTVTMIKDITLEPITVANGVEVAIDLNGKTISGTDSGTASFGLITNKGDLTINGTGAITLTAKNDRGWGAYSSVISNQVGGKLTVNGGTIQHLGGTSMAYAIDNLTNGKGTYAETIINGGEIKSTYRPIRMFLNGTEAQNILTVNAGTIESTGGNKAAIWMQTAGDVAHSGTLYVGEGAVIKNNVYLDADNLKNVREYPVEAYIAKAALAEGMTVLADAIPAEAAALVEYDTFWQVEQKNLAELTIEDACEEYINKIEKNVAELTYERYFDDTEWQTIVLPFDVTVTEELLAMFDFAYIYNASYKGGKQATIDYVEIKNAGFVMAANYPYLIKAKATGWNNIVVENAKLMPTEAQTLDCSSIFEVFSFIGNYATVDASDLDRTKGYFNLTSGAWSKMETVNPFRFYMQIELRNGGAFEYPTNSEGIRMRRVDENGNADTTGIDGVDAENAGDFIFDLHGRRVLEPLKGGLYIINGKKVIF